MLKWTRAVSAALVVISSFAIGCGSSAPPAPKSTGAKDSAATGADMSGSGSTEPGGAGNPAGGAGGEVKAGGGTTP